MSRRALPLLCIVAGSLAAGCTVDPPGLLVRLDAEPEWAARAGVHRLEVRVREAGERRLCFAVGPAEAGAPEPSAGCSRAERDDPLPWTLLLTPSDGDGARRVDVEAIAFDAAGRPIHRVSASNVRLSRPGVDELLVLNLCFTEGCAADAFDCDCFDGACGSRPGTVPLSDPSSGVTCGCSVGCAARPSGAIELSCPGRVERACETGRCSSEDSGRCARVQASNGLDDLLPDHDEPAPDVTVAAGRTLEIVTGPDARCDGLTGAHHRVVDGYCVVRVGDLAVEAGARIRATGPRPLVILAGGEVTIAGTVDVSSPSRDQVGAGGTGGGGEADTPSGGSPCAEAGECLGGRLGTERSDGGEPDSGGGGGGGGCGPGGDGGPTRSATGEPVAQGGRGGAARAPGYAGAPLAGGGSGASGLGRLPGGGRRFGRGGAGGGAIQITAGRRVLVGPTGRVLAGGGGGGAGITSSAGDRGSGGGGGAGGTVLLEAPAVTVQGTIDAGGGGGGGAAQGEGCGCDGQDGSHDLPPQPVGWAICETGTPCSCGLEVEPPRACGGRGGGARNHGGAGGGGPVGAGDPGEEGSSNGGGGGGGTGCVIVRTLQTDEAGALTIGSPTMTSPSAASAAFQILPLETR